MKGRNLVRLFHSSQAALATYYPRIRKWRHESGRYVFLAAMPKSGSSFLSRALERALDYRHSYLAFDYQNVEQELYLPRVLDAYGEGTVVQQHLKGNEPNLRILREFGIRPTVQTRNVFDIVVSLRDHLIRERLDNIPTLFVPPSYPELTRDRQLDIITSIFAPWLILFYVSWKRAEMEHGCELLWLRYEDCVDDWAAAIKRVAAFYGLEDQLSDIGNAIDGSLSDPRSRVNKGVVGRGEEQLSRRQKEWIRQLGSYYPEVDFSPVGL